MHWQWTAVCQFAALLARRACGLLNRRSRATAQAFISRSPVMRCSDPRSQTGIARQQAGITANYARIAELAAPQLQWLVGKTIGDVTFDADGVATIDGTARVFLDCRLGPLKEIRVHCRADGDGIEFRVDSR